MNHRNLRNVSTASFVALTTLACQAFAGPTQKPQASPVAPPVSKVVTAPSTAEKSTTGTAAAIDTKPAPSPAPLPPVSATKFCPTEGMVGKNGNLMHVDVGAMRGFLSTDRSRTAEVEFTYRGASKDTQPLLSGEIRRQIGLKLKAQDTCNVVYAMWHVAPTPGLSVAVKSNPGKNTYAACKDQGYINATPSMTKDVPPIVAGVPHTMRAELDGQKLKVIVDGTLVWAGSLPPEAAVIDGPPGVRSDNGTFDFQVRVPSGAAAAPPCK